ncbi:MAG: hypothetical protein WAO20_23200 [Acidobacteriota bacterium]
MNEKLLKRLVTLEGGYWRIRTERGDLDADEVQELWDYFNEIRFPYRFVHRKLCILEGPSKTDIQERLEHYYDGWAHVEFA